MPGHRATEQERWFLLQTVSPAGPVDLGATRTRKRNNGRRCTTAAHIISHLSGAITGRRQMLDGCSWTVAAMFGLTRTKHQHRRRRRWSSKRERCIWHELPRNAMVWSWLRKALQWAWWVNDRRHRHPTRFPTLMMNFSFRCALRWFYRNFFSVWIENLKAKSDTLSPLLKLLPSRSSTPAGKVFFPNSPCPSPTPFFQKIYMALAHLDRMSPDLFRMMPRLDEGSPLQRSNSLSSVEKSGQSPTMNRRQSYPLGLPHVRIMADAKS